MIKVIKTIVNDEYESVIQQLTEEWEQRKATYYARKEESFYFTQANGFISALCQVTSHALKLGKSRNSLFDWLNNEQRDRFHNMIKDFYKNHPAQ